MEYKRCLGEKKKKLSIVTPVLLDYCILSLQIFLIEEFKNI